MKFIHIADTHIGATPDADFPWGEQRQKEILINFSKLMDLCNEQKVDLLLIAGDVFHKSPPLSELIEVNYCFQKLHNTKVVLIAGNHDHIGRLSHYKEFIWAENVYPLFDSEMDSVYIEELNAEIYGFSYHQREINEPRYDHILPLCKDRMNILLAHGGNDKNIPMNYNKILQNGFDYVAMGHMHKPRIFSDRMAYVGSFEPMDKNEVGERGYIVGILEKEEEKSIIQIRFVPNAVRRYYEIRMNTNAATTNIGLREELALKIKELGMQNMFIVTIEGTRNKEITFQIDGFYSLGNIVDVQDNTVLEVDFEALLHENRENIIGMYINQIKKSRTDDKIKNKALFYGIEALLRGKE